MKTQTPPRWTEFKKAVRRLGGMRASALAARESGFSLVMRSAEEWNGVKASLVSEDGMDSWDAHDLMVDLGMSLDPQPTPRRNQR